MKGYKIMTILDLLYDIQNNEWGNYILRYVNTHCPHTEDIHGTQIVADFVKDDKDRILRIECYLKNDVYTPFPLSPFDKLHDLLEDKENDHYKFTLYKKIKNEDNN